MDNVNLADNVHVNDGASETIKGTPVSVDHLPNNLPTVNEADEKPVLPPRSPSGGLLGFANSKLPSIPWAPPPAPSSIPTTTVKQAAISSAPPKKAGGPFSWLSRGSTSKESVTSPTTTPTMIDRRNTQSSITTLNSNPDMMLSKLEEGADADGFARPARNSLKDRFKLLRMREEAGIPLENTEEGAIAGLAESASVNLEVSSPSNENPPPSPSATSRDPSLYNAALAPGTAAGVSAGPSATTEPVDWDLWQAVVYEGPAAVARTSPEELNKAIATGIPSAIRGVVWQVLAQSKNDELESVYKELLVRGTDKEKDRTSQSSGGTVTSNGSAKEPASSASSVHSNDDRVLSPGPVGGARSPSPHAGDEASLAKAQAAYMSARKRRAKEDAAALQKLERAIKRDMGARTSFSKFAASAGLQDGLFGVCKAYALFDEGVGYAQGMNFLAMPLLFSMPEEEAFCLLVRLMNQYHLRDLFIQDMPGLHMHLYQFERLLEDFEPALYCHLNRRQVTPHLYATQWFLTLFSYRFPLQLVLRIYDLILSEGLEAILKFGIVLMQKNASALLGINDMQNLTTFLRDKLFDVYIDQNPSAGGILESGFFGSSGAGIDKEVYRADMLVQDACSVKITPEMLKTYAAEWEEKNKADAAQAAELEHLKASNASLSAKVRNLEQRVQDHDTEHAALATDLVRTKVENEELKDENESLKGQVKELRAVVESQPEEVEARLKTEMDRLMARNQEVHGENTRLEEEMAEMEKNLVETKMAFAQVSSQ